MSLQRRLALLEPEPPLHHFYLGLAAMKQQDFGTAREHFTREVKRSEANPELHYWLGLASFELGDVEQARRHLTQALQASPSGKDRDLYAAKLDLLKELRSH